MPPQPLDTLHQPVMLAEVLAYLKPHAGGTYVDLTVGAGGHSLAIARLLGPGGQLIGLDRDHEILAKAQERLGTVPTKVMLRQARFSQLAAVLAELGIDYLDGGLMDLGVSSYQLDCAARGFSYQRPGPLSMSMEPEADFTAATIVNTWPQEKLTAIFQRLGEEPRARRISKAIVEARRRGPIRFTVELADIVAQAAGYHHSRKHPATKVFQALRIAVNNELEELERGLPLVWRYLQPGGRLVVLAYHSLEDRLVKKFFKQQWRDGQANLLTRKPRTPSTKEIQGNHRSRSAKLRAAEKIR